MAAKKKKKSAVSKPKKIANKAKTYHATDVYGKLYHFTFKQILRLNDKGYPFIHVGTQYILMNTKAEEDE